MRIGFALLICLASTAFQGCKSPQANTAAPVTPAPAALSVSSTLITTPSGLGIRDLVPGEGPTPRPGQTCVVHALGWVEEAGGKGAAFLDTRKRGFPVRFPLGGGLVIKGWEEGLATMKKGGRRLLRVPPALGYSPQELGRDIPPGSTLLFELELLDIR
ncbi:MAG: FKBP-type peptidyl-prolyl cis-trans isomerase [Holophagaceae bacterium]|uniref:Peptidyl-prolyl cis-trans isomerase n=1 Tax=Candidatus Geothrix skivensis TaxID=2954439 RepID=A0A9D7SEG2_9BACT|nr:FKBP-type peptidyl-prolyl cis-trans isomerase [Candidatus Geothrix skivensis]